MARTTRSGVRWTLGVGLLIAACAVLNLSRPFAVIAQGRSEDEWRDPFGDAHSTRYSPLSQISKENVSQLHVAWRVPAADHAVQQAGGQSGRYEETPIFVGGTVYTVSPLGVVAALDPATGRERWKYDPQGYKAGAGGNLGFIQRGLAYWTDGPNERLFVATADSYLHSIDAKTGRPDTAFGDGGKVDTLSGVRDTVRGRNIAPRGRPLIAGSVIVVGFSITDTITEKRMPPGDIPAYDVRTGKRLWTFHTVPRTGEPGRETWLDGSAEYSGNTNAWAAMTYDDALDYIYIATSTPTSDWYGGHRPGNTLFAETLICVRAKTGKRVWHFQAVHHGIWDYDFPTAPMLGDITVHGRTIKAVMQVSKQGFTYVFDRKSGRPVWPIVERPVPQSTIPGERTSATQPFPTKPDPFELQGSTEENLIDFTPELRQRAREHLSHFDHGPIFTPPSERGALYLPGNWGGANWGGAAFDPETKMLYVGSQTTPFQIGFKPADPEKSSLRYQLSIDPEQRKWLTMDGLPLFRPPYSRVTALDMNTGDRAWTAPLGDGPRDHPLLKGLKVPRLGEVLDFAPASGVLVTKTLVFANIARGTVQAQKPGRNPILYAFDKQSGACVHEVIVDGVGASAPPMTYSYQGRQYLLMATGFGEGAELIALTVR
jgi:quinoprotein glucose dehydrogenase